MRIIHSSQIKGQQPHKAGNVNGVTLSTFVTRNHMSHELSPEGPIFQKVGGYLRKCMLQHAKGQVRLLEMYSFTVFITILCLVFLVNSSKAVDL